MFANDKSIDTLEELFKETKKYLRLQGEYLKLDIIQKLAILLSSFMLILILAILGAMAVYYFSFMLVYLLESWVGSLIISYAIVGSLLLLAALGIYLLRQKLIFRPTINFLAHLLLDEHNK